MPIVGMELIEKQQVAKEYLEQGKYQEAIALYELCIEAAPHQISNYWELGLALTLEGKEAEALALWLQALIQGETEGIEAKTVELIKVLEAEGIKRLQSDKSCQAEKIYWQILEVNPTHHLAYYNLGCALEMQGKIAEAVACYQQATALKPDFVEVYNNLGTIFAKQGQIKQAIACYQQCVKLNPNSAMAYYNLGCVLEQEDNLEEASSCYQQALVVEPNYAEAYNNLGNILEKQDKLEEANFCYQQAISLKPNYAEAHVNWGLILLGRGDFERGFAEYEWRWQMEKFSPRSFSQPLWAGEELRGKTILLHAEQGFGDAIQFIRYAPLVQARGGIVVVECHQPLVRLLKTISSIDRVIARESSTLPEFDVHAPLMSLPYILGTTLETVPDRVPYLNYDPSPRLRLEPSSLMKVGIVWAGNPDFPKNRQRSCTLNHFLGILDTVGFAFYSLQKGPQVVELTQLSEKVQIQDLSNQLDDFADTAAVVAQLNLIITVDTAVAHLAGALGKPVWLLLPFSPDWRWMLEREDSPLVSDYAFIPPESPWGLGRSVC